MVADLRDGLAPLVAALDERGFIVEHDGDEAVIFKLSDSDQPGSQVWLIWLDEEWWALVSSRPQNAIAVELAASAIAGDAPTEAKPIYEERCRLTLRVIDQLQSDPSARERLLEIQ